MIFISQTGSNSIKVIVVDENVLIVAICYDSIMKNHICKIESVYLGGV
ncbi:hypothetical protein CBU02nite_31690 [Clostridium butyricum]|jgi:hypothetical protein|uniref:Uncharacterized protein n=1 Tax=Clostridium butyricum TaxID=1492 RepID=A0A512TRD0_CLOBU|nr:hypothetical protein [Clostridium butyricum]GEQ22663.1 hypothetical protein CBU02nite_31690 [Clostridium butyricum]